MFKIDEIIRGKERSILPYQVIFFDINAQEILLPPDLMNADEYALYYLQKTGSFAIDVKNTRIHESEWLQKADLQQNTQLEHSCVGGGTFRTRVLDETFDSIFLEFETGARWRVYKRPFCRKFVSFPLKGRDNLDGFSLSNAVDADKFKGVEDRICFFKSLGYLVSAEISGFFSGVWYHLMPFEELLSKMILDKDFIKEVIRVWAEFNLMMAEHYLELGVNQILLCDDLGTGKGLFISPCLYEELLFPWHQQLARLCHRYGAFCHLHSHGNINEILPLIAMAGVDILNPVDMREKMDIEKLLKEYERMAFYVSLQGLVGDDYSFSSIEKILKKLKGLQGEYGRMFLRMDLNSEKMGKQIFTDLVELTRKCCWD